MYTSLLLVPSLVALCALGGCRSSEPVFSDPARPAPPPPPRAAEWSPPSDWDTMSAVRFEEMLLANMPDHQRTPLPQPIRAQLREALNRMDQSSVRAATMLARSYTDEAGNGLLRRLQLREVGPDRASDAGDVVAAAGLARFPRPERWWRIVELVDGVNPHPDLEVRVECACTALHYGIDRVIPFLLQVIRIGTWAGQDDVLDFTPDDTTAWARGRAAEALSIRAGVPLRYDPDAPVADREREARRLEALLADAIASADPLD